MKNFITFAAIATIAAISSLSLHAADVLTDDIVIVTGTISTPSDSTAQFSKTKTVPLTAKSLLQLLGPVAVSPKNVKFFYDQTQNTCVLASKDKATIYATLLRASSSDYVSWSTDAKGSFTGAGAITSLDTLTGTETYGITFVTKKSVVITNNFTAYGTYNDQRLILKAKVTYLSAVK